MVQDMRLALRRAFLSRSFTLCVVVILGIGIGAASTMLSVLNALTFRPLSLPDADSLIAVTTVDQANLRRPTALTVIDQLRGAELGATGWCGMNAVIETVESGGRVLDAYGELMAGDCPTVMRVSPAIGRWFEPAEAPLSGAPLPVMVITDRFWARMFDRAPEAVGRTVQIGSVHAQVVGVMPPDFRGFSPEYATDFIVPFNLHRPASGAQFLIGRLNEGATIELLRSQVKTMWPSVLEAVTPQGPARAQIAERTAEVEPFSHGSSVLRRLYSTPVRNMTILAAALIVLVCVNVGGLLLTRISSRAHEFAAMRALGARGIRLTRPVYFEAAVYAALGGCLGIPLAYAGAAAFENLLPWANIPWVIALAPDKTILTAIVSGVFVLAFVIASIPAWAAARYRMLRSDVRTATRPAGLATQALLVTQVALTVMLVFTGGLVIRSFNALWSVDPGFDSDGVLSIRLVPNPGGYDKFDQAPYYSSLLERLNTLPGVQSAGAARYFGTMNAALTGQPVTLLGTASESDGFMEYVTPRFFETVGIPLLRGRDVAWSDRPDMPKVVLVSESLARALSSDGDVVGRVIRHGAGPAAAEWLIIGVVGDVSFGNFRHTAPRIVYAPGVQAGQATYATVHLKTNGEPMALAKEATEVISVSGREHVQRAVPINFLFSNGAIAERMGTAAGTVTAAIALMISCLGLFALLSHAVGQRRREIGIRMAMGASPLDAAKLIVSTAAILVATGFAIGIPGTAAAASLVQSLLFNISTFDVTTMVASAAALIITACVAAAVPALRAARVNPAVALRDQ